MKKKYVSQDIRTGYQEGEIVELDNDELAQTPFNVFLQYVDHMDEKERVEKAEIEKKKNELGIILSDKGLSNKRISKVLEKFDSIESLKKDKSFDNLTNDFIAKEFGSSSKKKSKKGDN